EDDELVALPDNHVVRIRGVQVHGHGAAQAIAPTRVALNLDSVEVNEMARGVTLATRDSLAVTRRADVRIELLPEGRALRHGARLRVYQGTSETTARLVVSATRASPASPWHS